MSTSATVNIFTFKRNARATSGKTSRPSLTLKNDCFTVDQPGEFTIASPRSTATTTVLTRAMETLAAGPPPWRIRDRRSWTGSRDTLLKDWGLRLFREPGRLDLVERPVGLQPGERLVDARGQLAALREDEPELAAPARRGRELADDRAVRDLHRRHVEGGRQVDNDAVDLVGLERVDGIVQMLVRAWLRPRLDGVRDQVVAGRPDLGAELFALQRGDAGRVRVLVGLERDDRLVLGVVRAREVDRLGALLRDRHLGQVEVEVLRSRCIGLVEVGHLPLHLRVREAHLLGHRVGD